MGFMQLFLLSFSYREERGLSNSYPCQGILIAEVGQTNIVSCNPPTHGQKNMTQKFVWVPYGKTSCTVKFADPKQSWHEHN